MSGKKFDEGKPAVEILSAYALPQIALALQYGKEKYGEWNYREGFKWTRLSGSLLRHIYAWIRREDKDPETGLSHLAHAGANILMLLDHEILGLGEDDRWVHPKQLELERLQRKIMDNQEKHGEVIFTIDDDKEDWPLFPRMQK